MSAVVSTVTKTIQDNYRELSRGGQVVKKIIMASNTLVLLFGLLLVIIGGVAAGGQINALTSTTLASGIIVIGIFVMLIAILGCWGAMVENKIILYVYFALLLFFAFVEFAVGIAAYVKKDDLPDFTSQLWTTLYNQDKNAIDNIESQFQCCGWYNQSDRSTPPFGTEQTCSGIFQGQEGGGSAPSCYSWYWEYLGAKYGDSSAASRLALQNFQNLHQCCGWTSLEEVAPSYWYPWDANSTMTCPQATGNMITCSQQIQLNWSAHYAVHDDQSIIALEQFGAFQAGSYMCCGWNSTSDMVIPPYSNITCANVHGYNTTCSVAVDAALASTYQITGGVGIALGILEIATIILTLILIVKIPGGNAPRRHEEGNAGVMEELHDDE